MTHRATLGLKLGSKKWQFIKKDLKNNNFTREIYGSFKFYLSYRFLLRGSYKTTSKLVKCH